MRVRIPSLRRTTNNEEILAHIKSLMTWSNSPEPTTFELSRTTVSNPHSESRFAHASPMTPAPTTAHWTLSSDDRINVLMYPVFLLKRLHSKQSPLKYMKPTVNSNCTNRILHRFAIRLPILKCFVETSKRWLRTYRLFQTILSWKAFRRHLLCFMFYVIIDRESEDPSSRKVLFLKWIIHGILLKIYLFSFPNLADKIDVSHFPHYILHLLDSIRI